MDSSSKGNFRGFGERDGHYGGVMLTTGVGKYRDVGYGGERSPIFDSNHRRGHSGGCFDDLGFTRDDG